MRWPLAAALRSMDASSSRKPGANESLAKPLRESSETRRSPAFSSVTFADPITNKILDRSWSYRVTSIEGLTHRTRAQACHVPQIWLAAWNHRLLGLRFSAVRRKKSDRDGHELCGRVG